MFTLDPIHPLFDAILGIVAKQPGIKVSDLHKKLKAEKQEVTLQHLYRKINTLMEEQILLKDKGALSVNLMWLSFLEYFAASAKEALIVGKKTNAFPLKEGEKISLSVDTFLDVQTLWNHLLVQLYRTAPEKYLYKFYSHAWWIWSKQQLDANFYKRIKEKNVRCFWLYGNDTFLDKAAADMHKDLFDSRIAKETPFPKEGYNLNVYGEYIVECIFPENIARHLGLLFSSIGSTAEEDRSVLADIFTLAAPYKVTVWRNIEQAQKLQREIGKHFLLGPEAYKD